MGMKSRGSTHNWFPSLKSTIHQNTSVFHLWLSDLQTQGWEWNHPGILLSGNRKSLNYIKVNSSFRFGICSRVSILRRMPFSLASTILMAPLVCDDILCSLSLFLLTLCDNLCIHRCNFVILEHFLRAWDYNGLTFFIQEDRGGCFCF